MRPLPLLVLVAAASLATAGCVGPSDSGETCPVPGAAGSVNYLLATTNGTADVPATGPGRWTMVVTCTQDARALSALSLRIATADHGELIGEPEGALGAVLTLYAEPQPGSHEGTPLEQGVPPMGRTPAYRLRIHNDGRDAGIDTGDWFELTFDADGDRGFGDDLPDGGYRLQLRDRETGEGLGLAVHRVYGSLGG